MACLGTTGDFVEPDTEFGEVLIAQGGAISIDGLEYPLDGSFIAIFEISLEYGSIDSIRSEDLVGKSNGIDESYPDLGQLGKMTRTEIATKRWRIAFRQAWT